MRLLPSVPLGAEPVPCRPCGVLRSRSEVRGSREDTLRRDSDYQVPSLAKQSLLRHRCAAGKVLVQKR